ncbi:hypothetical protein HK102_005862 [Quaeritorhiza haematococci]|nr:hypothetical protein HK102_005862 [Quaeritorhiza haematococci]
MHPPSTNTLALLLVALSTSPVALASTTAHLKRSPQFDFGITPNDAQVAATNNVAKSTNFISDDSDIVSIITIPPRVPRSVIGSSDDGALKFARRNQQKRSPQLAEAFEGFLPNLPKVDVSANDQVFGSHTIPPKVPRSIRTPTDDSDGAARFVRRSHFKRSPQLTATLEAQDTEEGSDAGSERSNFLADDDISGIFTLPPRNDD